MKTKPIRKARPLAAAALLSLVLSSGCVSFKIGDPEVFVSPEYEDGVADGAVTVESVVSSVGVQPADEKNLRLEIALKADVKGTVERKKTIRKVTLRRQKKLAFGFGPSMAEYDYRPADSLYPMSGWDYVGNGNYHVTYQQGGNMYKQGVGPAVPGLTMTVWAILFEPFFGSWTCDSHHWGNTKKTVENLTHFSPAQRKEIGAWTWKDEASHPQLGTQSKLSHGAWFGFHRYSTYELDDPVFVRTESAGTRSLSYVRNVHGPFLMELSIPELGFKETDTVGADYTGLRFMLPGVGAGGREVDAEIRVSPAPDAQPKEDVDRRAVEDAAKRTFAVRIVLPAKADSLVIEKPAAQPAPEPKPAEKPDSGPTFRIDESGNLVPVG